MIALTSVVVALGLFVAPPPPGDPTPPTPPAGPTTPPGATGAPPAAAPQVGWCWDVLPFPKAIKNDFVRASDRELAQYIVSLRGRLLLDEQTAVAEIGQDIELWLKYALATQLLLAMHDDPFARAAARDAAYGLYTLGLNYATRDDVRASVDALASGLQGPAKGYSELVTQTVRMLRSYGYQWYVEIAPRTLKDEPRPVATLHQMGLVARGEERLAEAVDAFSQGLSLGVTTPLGLSAVDTLLRLDKEATDQTARGLEAAMVGRLPALGAELAGIFARHADRRATAKFEADPTKVGVADTLVQIGRYIRQGRPGAADVLVRQMLGTHPEEQAVWDRAADFYHGQQRFESLRTLFADAEAKGKMSPRLREVRVSARTHLITQEQMGAQHHLLAEGDIEADLKALAAAGGSEGTLQVMMVRLVLALGRRMAGAQNPATTAAAQATLDKEVEKVLDAMIAAFPKDVRVLEAALGTAIALDQGPKGIKRVAALGAKLDDVARAGLELELLELQASLAIRERDAGAMKEAVARLAGLEKLLGKMGALKDPARWPATVDKAQWTYDAWIVRAANIVIGGAALPVDDPKADTDLTRGLAILKGLDGAFDETSDRGRTLAQAVALTRGTLLYLRADPAASESFAEARRVERTSAFALLAGGARQLVLGDPLGAAETFERALTRADRPATRQALQAMAGTARFALGDTEGGKRHFAEAVAGWDAAHLPPTLDIATARPLSEGRYQLGIEMAYGLPGTSSVRVVPMMLLVPEAAFSREKMSAGSGGAKAPGGP